MSTTTSPAIPAADVLTFRRRNRSTPDELVIEALDGDGNVVGIAVCELDLPRARATLSVSVEPVWRNLGIGRALTEQAIDAVDPLGVRFLVGRHAKVDQAAARMLARTDLIVARRVGTTMIRVAIAVPRT
jgi:GNAT superfamily N-acetyltransferase